MLKQYIDKQNNSDGELNMIKLEKCKPNFKNIKNMNKVISYPSDFDIIDKEIFKDIIPSDITSGGIECLCIINSGKVLIRFEDGKQNQFNLFIGNMDLNNHKFCLELILDYINKNSLTYHFSRLKKEKKDEKILHADINLIRGDKFFGSIINLNSNNNINNQGNINPFTQTINQNNPEINLHQDQLNHVKFLLNLHFLHERLNIKINDSLKEHSFKEKYYLINKDIIKKFKEIYKYNELLQALNTNEIKKLINEYKKDTLYIQKMQIKELTEKILKMIDKKYYDLIKNIPNKNELLKLDFKIEKKYYKNNSELFYYKDCQLIDGEMSKFFPDKKQILEESLVNCTFGENAVFLSFGKIINIGKLDNNYIFNAEMIIKLKNEKSIDSIFNQIKEFNYNLYKENLKFTQINFNGNHPFDYEVFIISKENDIILNKEEEQQSLTKIVIDQIGKNKNQIFRGTIFVNQSVKNLILFFIDYKDLQMKSKNFLKDNYNNNLGGYYYLLNYQWLLKYLEVYNLSTLFQYLMKGNIIETIKNYERLSSDEKISEIMMIINKWNPNIINSRSDNVNNIALKNNNLLNLKFDYFHPNSDINFKYYYDFVLVKKEAYEALIKEFGLNYHIMNYCYIGDNSIFIYLNNDNKYTLQIGYLSTNNYYFSTDLFLDFNSKKMFEEGINLLIKEGNVKFWKTNLILNGQNDYYSPIFGQNQNIIGNAFMVNKTSSKVDYQNLFINNNLKTLVLFYLENEILKRTLKTNNINKCRKYYLINTNWLKEFKNIYGYNNLLNEFAKCGPLLEMVKNLKGDEKLSITEKQLCFLIKSLPLDINMNYNKMQFDFIKNAQIEPNSELYQFQNNNFLNYYNNFEIISEQIYNRIFGNSQSNDINLNQQKNNYVNCIFFEDIIMIELSRYVSGIEDYVIEAKEILGTYK